LYEGTERFDRGNWHVHSVSYIKHTTICTQMQPYHVDNKHRYEEVKTFNRQDCTYQNIGGYSIFLGMDKQNSLTIGWADEAASMIEGIEDISFPYNSILVISDHLVHAGNMFKGKESIYWKKDLDTMYSLKGFISVNEFGAPQTDIQGWFRIGKHPFMGRL